MTHNPRKPVVFACAGSSPAGNLSWQVAKELERQGAAEMSCLAGIGARKPAFLRTLRDRQVWVIDGCPIHCGAGIFDLIGRPPDHHIRLADFGIKKQQPLDEQTDVTRLAASILAHLRNGTEQRADAVAATGKANVLAYEYKCRTCTHRFEVTTTFRAHDAADHDDAVKPNDYLEQQPACPACHSHDVDHMYVRSVNNDSSRSTTGTGRPNDERQRPSTTTDAANRAIRGG